MRWNDHNAQEPKKDPKVEDKKKEVKEKPKAGKYDGTHLREHQSKIVWRR